MLARHGVEVTSPGASDLITTQAAFEAFKGFDVTVRTLNPIEGGEERIIEGRLQERTTTDVVINVQGVEACQLAKRDVVDQVASFHGHVERARPSRRAKQATELVLIVRLGHEHLRAAKAAAHHA